MKRMISALATVFSGKVVKTLVVSLAPIFAIAALSPFAALAEPLALDDLSIMALGALDGRAVVKTSDNKMHVLKLGSSIPGTNALVTQILADKLVVEETIEADGVAKRQTVWLTKGAAAGDKVVVQRLSTEAPASHVTRQTLMQVRERAEQPKQPVKPADEKR